MNNEQGNTTTTSGGIGLPTILFLIFLILKLTGTIDWSWFWVFSPLLIPIAFIFMIFVVFGIIGFFSS